MSPSQFGLGGLLVVVVGVYLVGSIVNTKHNKIEPRRYNDDDDDMLPTDLFLVMDKALDPQLCCMILARYAVCSPFGTHLFSPSSYLHTILASSRPTARRTPADLIAARCFLPLSLPGLFIWYHAAHYDYD